MLRPYLIRQYLGFCWPCGVILAGTALYVRLRVYMGLSLFIIRRALHVSGCMRTYVYNLTFIHSMVLIDSITPLLILKYQL